MSNDYDPIAGAKEHKSRGETKPPALPGEVWRGELRLTSLDQSLVIGEQDAEATLCAQTADGLAWRWWTAGNEWVRVAWLRHRAEVCAAAFSAERARAERAERIAAAERALRKAEVAEHVESDLATAEAMLRGAISDAAARSLAAAERATNDASAALIALGIEP